MSIINENDQSCTVLVDGKETKYIKIDTEKLKLNHISDLQKASEVLSTRNINQALFFTKGILKSPPSVVQYEKAATEIVRLLKRFYFDLKPHNLTHLVHSLIKNISTDVYGKAQTFIYQVELWNNDIKVIHEFKKGKSKD